MSFLIFLPSSMVVILVSTFPYHNGGGNMGDQGHENKNIVMKRMLPCNYDKS